MGRGADTQLSSVRRLGGTRRVRFVLHEVAEYVVAAALIAVGTRASGGAEILLVVTGGVLLVLGACTSGRLGAVDLLSRRSHHAGDLAIVAALALSPAIFYRELHLVGIVLAELVALVLLRIERGTLYDDRPRNGAGRSAVRVANGGAVVTGAATDGALGAPPQASPQVSEAAQRIGAGAATAATVAAAAASQIAPVAGRAARIGVRSLGLVAGATRRAARDHAAERARRGG
ncbi:MAG: hypothetical protein ACYCTE_05785 [Acidimicrobiales bacterium]